MLWNFTSRTENWSKFSFPKNLQMPVWPSLTAQLNFQRRVEYQLFRPWKPGIVGQQFRWIEPAADLEIFFAGGQIPIAGGK